MSEIVNYNRPYVFLLLSVRLNVFRVKFFDIFIVVILRFWNILLEFQRHYFLQQVFLLYVFDFSLSIFTLLLPLEMKNRRKPGSVFRKSSQPLIFPVFMNSTQLLIILSENFFSSSVKTTPKYIKYTLISMNYNVIYLTLCIFFIKRQPKDK